MFRIPAALALISSALLLTSACARFKIEELEPKVITSIEVLGPNAPNPEGLVQGSLRGRVLGNIPARIVSDGSQVFAPDPSRGLIRVFSKGGKPIRVLAANKPAGSDDIKLTKIKSGVPGWLSSDGDGNTYIQLLQADPIDEKQKPLVPPEDRAAQDALVETAPAPSVILHVTEEEVTTIGKTGPGGESFPNLIRVDAGPDELMFALWLENGEKTLGVYQKNKRIRTFDAHDTGSADERRTYQVDVEDIVADPKGDSAVASVAFRSRTSFDVVSRRLYRLTGGVPSEIYRTEDPDDQFAWIRPDGGFYMLNTEGDGSRMLFKAYNKEGEYVNNRLIIFPGLRSSWRDTFLTVDGRIYSTRLLRGRLELYEWK